MTEKTIKSSPVFWLLNYLKPYSLTIFGVFLSLSLAAGTVLFLGQGLRILIDQGFAAQNPQILNQALLTLLGLVLVIALASFARSFLSSWLGENVAADIRQQAFEKLLDYPPRFFQENSSGIIHARLHNDTTLIQVLLGGAASTGLRSIIQFLGAMALLVFSNPKLAALSCLIIPIVLLPIIVFGKKVRQEAKEAQEAEAQAANLSQENLDSLLTVQAYNQQARVNESFQQLNKDILSKAYRRILAQSSLSSIVIFLVFAAVSIFMWYGGQEVIYQKLTSGEMMAFIFYAVLAAGSINSLSMVYGDWQRALGACSHLEELLADNSDSLVKPSRSFPVNQVGQISFEDVDFSYPTQKGHLALNRLSLTIKRGETVAFVGPSGAGKSTLFNLLLRFYEPSHGRVLLEELNISELPLNELREAIGWVPQHPAIFNDSVTNNIKLARPDASENEIIEAAKSAYAIDFISKLSQGFETSLGDKGVALSSGQRQRIAIARALLKNPSILLLDEATNSLDSESEFQIQKALDRLMKGRTTLIVAHRLSTVLKANRIVVMDQGQIVSSGSHTSLIRNCPIYRRFVSLQFEQGEQENTFAMNG